MNFSSLLKSTFKSLFKHKMRSFLSILGIIIGVISVVIMVSVSEGFRSYMMKEYRSVGQNLMWAIPQYDSMEAESFSQFTNKDLKIFGELEFVQNFSPYVATPHYLKRNGREGVVQIVGTDGQYGELRSLNVVGRYLTDNDIVNMSNVCIISDEVRRNYFYQNFDPLGESVELKGTNFTVVGYLPPKDSKTKSGLNEESDIYIPYTTLQQRFGTQRIDMVMFSVVDETKSEQYKTIIQQRMIAEKKGNFKLRLDSVYENMKNINMLFDIATAVTALITSVGLIVSGIGIMNVLLMSIAERKWEIGLRKAVGADNQSILVQFLTESLMLCIIGATTGLLCSIAMIEAVNFFFNLSIKISWVAVGISVGFCSLVGLFFGIYPAIKAARLDPLECLEQKA